MQNESKTSTKHALPLRRLIDSLLGKLGQLESFTANQRADVSVTIEMDIPEAQELLYELREVQHLFESCVIYRVAFEDALEPTTVTAEKFAMDESGGATFFAAKRPVAYVANVLWIMTESPEVNAAITASGDTVVL